MLIRPAAAAGTFYPASPVALNEQLDQLLAQYRSEAISNSAPAEVLPPKCLIVPHAGYVYSGPTAALAYNALADGAQAIDRVVLLGLSHRVFFRGIATSSAQKFATPLGDIELDRASLAPLIEEGCITENDSAHEEEHSLEVQLPFLQRLLGSFKLIPLATGECETQDVAALLVRLWGSNNTLVVVSSDLSHFHPYQQAQSIDQQTCTEILRLYSRLTPEQACGCRGINGLLHQLQKAQYRIELIDYRNSGDTAGDKNRVVGYGAFAIYANQR